MELLEQTVEKELAWIEFPPNWVQNREGVLDVAIIGGGMAGASSALALKQVGIEKIAIFDENDEGLEGPWIKQAHMRVLRTDKCTTGPCLCIPILTFQSWYEAAYGKEAWEKLNKPTPHEWMDYLKWFRKVLHLPVQNNHRLVEIRPFEDVMQLTFDSQGTHKVIHAKKVILATGRSGSGGIRLPDEVKTLSKSFWAHTYESIDYSHFKDKSILILGCGASAFDAAAMALEAGANQVSIIYRRDEIPTQNKFAEFSYAGFEQGFHLLDDNWRWKFIAYASQFGIPPPHEALDRVKDYQNLHYHPGKKIHSTEDKNGKVYLKTPTETLQGDFLIVAAGFDVDVLAMKEIASFAPLIDTWNQHIDTHNHLGHFPYLGSHYQLIEKKKGEAPFLKHLYFFNYGALVSHGLTSSSIDAISTGAQRIAQGIAADFLAEDVEYYFSKLEEGWD